MLCHSLLLKVIQSVAGSLSGLFNILVLRLSIAQNNDDSGKEIDIHLPLSRLLNDDRML